MANKNDFEQDLADWIDAIENKILFDGTDNAKLLVSNFLKYLQNKSLIEDTSSELPF